MKRKYESIKNYPGIYRVSVYSPETNRWEEPMRGCRFAASRYETISLTTRRSKKHFNTFDAAKDFRSRNGSSAEGAIGSPTIASGMLFKELVEKYESNELIHKAQSTQEKYLGYRKYFELFWERPVKEINGLVVVRLPQKFRPLVS